MKFCDISVSNDFQIISIVTDPSFYKCNVCITRLNVAQQQGQISDKTCVSVKVNLSLRTLSTVTLLGTASVNCTTYHQRNKEIIDFNTHARVKQGPIWNCLIWHHVLELGTLHCLQRSTIMMPDANSDFCSEIFHLWGCPTHTFTKQVKHENPFPHTTPFHHIMMYRYQQLHDPLIMIRSLTSLCHIDW